MRSELGVDAGVATLGEVALGGLAAVRIVGSVTGAIPPVVGWRSAGRGGRPEGAVGAGVVGPSVRPVGLLDGGGAAGASARRLARAVGMLRAELGGGDAGGGCGELVDGIEVDEGLAPLWDGPLAAGDAWRFA